MDFEGTYNNRKVFLTGHTGFKGSWLSTWLAMLGAKTRGFSIGVPSVPNHFSSLENKIEDCRGDITDFETLRRSIMEFSPEIVFHLAAQPLVRLSYERPIETFSTNIMGTVNLLEACRLTPSVRAIVVITSDKCYENKEWIWGYRENDRLGGYDPYSASKGCAEIVAASFRRSFPGKCLIATCRAGNVIGGGDWAADRLVPDLVRAAAKGEATTIRMPYAARPWQHVLEPLRGYLLLGQRLLEGKSEFAESWNFGPGVDGNRSVEELVRLTVRHWDKIRYEVVPNCDMHEASLLMLDCGKSSRFLAWRPIWTLEEGVEQTVRWYREFYENGRVRTCEQIEKFAGGLP